MDELLIKMYEIKMKNSSIEIHPLRVNIAGYKQTPGPFKTWGPRRIPDTELILIHKGLFNLSYNEHTLRAGKNDLLVIFSRELHTFQSLGKSGCISCIHCDLPENNPLPRIQNISDPEISEAFRRCADTFAHPDLPRDELLRAILTELLIRLRSTRSTSASGQVSPRVKEIVRYLQENQGNPVSGKDLAREFHISPQHINYLFKTELGTTPTTLQHLERVKKAFLLIQNERLSVKEAAARTGFYDAYHFSKVFKKAYGFPPGRVSRFFKAQS